MSLPKNSRIIGWGFDVPDLVVTNDDLAPIVDTSDEWIVKRTGISERRFVDNDQGSTPLADRAVRKAVAKAGIELDELDAIICGSLSPDVSSPGNSSLLHRSLGLSPRYAFDIRNQCSAFVYSAVLANQLITTGAARYVVVVGCEVHSSGLDYDGARGRDVTVLFGDGAGAVVFGPSDDVDQGLLSFRLHADGQYAEKLCVLGPGARQKPRLRSDQLPPDSEFVFPKMEGRFVFKHAVEGMSSAIRDVVEEAGLTIPDLSLLLPHQANLRINQFVALTLELEERQIANNIERYGNTTAATIPILLSECADAGRIHEGDLVCMAAFGAGFTWGATLFRW